tara:strand:- start:325 stop:573 length:249 start_codon:yes stop_codon:yes gene_type:complete
MLDYLLDPTFLLTLDNINKKDVEYILSSFKIDELKKRNNYLYKNYVKTQNKLKWLNSEKEHREWADNNNKINYYKKIINKKK